MRTFWTATPSCPCPYLPKSIIVLGGGVIACEYAATFASLGVKVTMLDRAEWPLSFLDPELVDYFLQQLTSNHGTFQGNCDITSVKWDGVSSVCVKLKDGTKLHADKAFVALGRVANIDSLCLDTAGLAASDRGLLTVNNFCQTAVPHIYAVGDTIGPPALASASMEQGRRAICHAFVRDGKSRTGFAANRHLHNSGNRHRGSHGASGDRALRHSACCESRLQPDCSSSHHGVAVWHAEVGRGC